MAKSLGADQVLDQSNAHFKKKLFEISKGRSVDIAIDCAGNGKNKLHVWSFVEAGKNREIF